MMSTLYHLIRKELALYFLDRRFLVVFGMCALLAILSVALGSRHYVRRLEEASSVSESSRRTFQETAITNNNLRDLVRSGYWISRKPSPLSPLVYGQSGTQPRASHIRTLDPPRYQTSHFAADPVHAQYGVLDLSFIVTVVLSLCVILFTHDAVCGEKESGTLRLVASFPVSRTALAAAKMGGAALAILVPFVLIFMVSVAVLSQVPETALSAEDGLRIVALIGVFGLYLAAYVAFGVLVSALVEKRITAFILLLSIWTIWLFAVPNLADRVAREVTSEEGFFETERKALVERYEKEKQADKERDAYWERVPNYSDLPEEEQAQASAEAGQILNSFDALFIRERAELNRIRLNRLRSRSRLARAIAILSPAGAAAYLAEDLAQTGAVNLEEAERSLEAYYTTINAYYQQKRLIPWRKVKLADFPWYQAQAGGTLASHIHHNLFPLLSLILFIGIGFAGAFVAILRYDVR